LTRSKPESEASHATGEEPERPAPGKRAKGDDADEAPPFDRSSRLEVELEVDRRHAIGWAIFGIAVGALLVWQFGTVGVWGGYLLLAIGAYRAFQLVQTVVYFLRRSVPWNRSAPVLVVELGKRAMAFPRDWFATEADQRRIVHALIGVGVAEA
jgi:hypothetical protein